MIKLTYSTDISDSVGVGGEVIKSASELKKQASTIFNCEYDALKPPEGKTGIHLVALGAMETYGFNRNADGFKQADCRDRCDTFVKHGHVFQHHRNKDPEKAIGEIKCAAYNADMDRVELYIWADNEKAHDHLERLEKTGEVPFSMACRVPSDTCFPKGTLVATDTGYRAIETIKTGDLVVSNNDRLQPVIATSERPANRFTHISVSGLPLEIESTENHPYSIVRENIVRSCRGSVNGKKRRHTFNETARCTCCHRIIDMNAEWVKASDIHVDDYIRVKIPETGTTNVVGENFAYMTGMYIGDGNLKTEKRGHYGTGEKRITGISISAASVEKDKGIIDKIEKAVHNTTGKEVTVVPEKYDRKAYAVNIYDQLLSNRICSLCGAGSRTKFISREIDTWSRREKAALLAGLIDSDGCITPNKHTARYISVNRGLALSVQRICWSLGLRATCYLAESEDHTSTFGATGPSYGVQFSEFIPELFEFSDKLSRHPELKDAKTNGATILMAEGYAYLRVDSVNTFNSDNKAVYNIEVGTDHTYNAEGADVHNCSLCGATRTGPGDPKECEHIKYQLGKIAEDGKFVGMINNDPVWFDISFVGRPADRIAWNLKTASGLSDSIKQADYEGVTLPDDLAVTSENGMRKLALMKDLAAMNQKMAGWVKKASFESKDERYLFEMRKMAALHPSDGLLNDLRAYSPKDAFAALADAGVVLDARSFFKYAMGQEYGTVVPYMAEIEKAASEVLTKAVKEGSCAPFCMSSEFDVYSQDDLRRKPVSTEIIEKLAEYGCDNTPSKIVDITLSGKTPEFAVDESPEKGVISSVSIKLAEKYVSYKLAAVDAVLNSRYGINRNKNNLAAISAAQDLKRGERNDK